MLSKNEMLYLECESGISGDMTVAALLDLGASEEKLRAVLDSIPVNGYSIRISDVKKAGIRCKDFDVVLDEDNHDHNMDYLYGHEHEHHHDHEHHHEHDHEHEHEHSHEHEHEHEHHSHEHHHVHRGMNEITAIINGTDMTENAKQIAFSIFDVLAKAEAKTHGTTYDEVHLHEVGAIDSICDIIAAAVCIDDIGAKNIVVSPLCEGTGTVRCAHGILPIPVPAVLNIVADHHIILERTTVKGELVTPTGAAIVAAIKTTDELPAKYRINGVGLGAGKREHERSGILRAMIIEKVL